MRLRAFQARRGCCLLFVVVVATVALVCYRSRNATVARDSGNNRGGWSTASSNPSADPVLPVDDVGQDAVPVSSGSFSTSGPEVLERAVAAAARSRGVVQPLRPKIVRRYWQMVDGDVEIYLYSAYYDDRLTLKEPCVRIIGVADTGVRNLYCLLWYDTVSAPRAAYVDVKSVGPNIRPHPGGPEFGQYIFSCKAPERYGSPDNVSVVSVDRIQPSNVLEIRRPFRPSAPSDVLEFGHCMSVVYWHHDPLGVVEWLELHRMWGVGEVNVYGYELDNATLGVMRFYAKTGFVKLHRVSTVLDDDNEFAVIMNMSPVINDCLYRNLYRYRYVVCTDLDEMIVPRGRHLDYFTMLEAARLKVSSEGRAKVKSFIFRNAYFFQDFGPVVEEPWYLTTARYQVRVSPSRFGYSSKSITRTLDCLGLQNHYCWEPVDGAKSDPGWNVDVEVETGMNHHYKRCHFDQYLEKDGVCLRLMAVSYRDQTMDKFKVELSSRVAKVLVELDLAETRAVLDITKSSSS